MFIVIKLQNKKFFDLHIFVCHTLPKQHYMNVLFSAGSSSRRTRGPTTMREVHTRAFEERKPIILNAANQPIGPDDKTLNEFSSFLGTLARNGTLAPLDEVNWRKMPTKDALWDYVLVSQLLHYKAFYIII